MQSEALQHPDTVENSGCYPMFERKAKLNRAKTKEAGQDVWDDVIYIRLVTPGDKTNEPHRPMRPGDKRKYLREFKAWEADSSADAALGHPLGKWGGVSPAQVKELEYHGIRTVEHLAGLSDSQLQAIGPIRPFMEAAKAFLAEMKAGAPTKRLEAENADLKNQMTALQGQMQQLLERQAAIDTAKPEKSAPKK